MQSLKDRAMGAFTRNPRFEEFDIDSSGGYQRAFSGGGESPESPPSPERPPLRRIDKYVRAECPCLSKRYTIALLTCLGFVISFGMRCNMGMAKLKIDTGKTKMKWSVGIESAIDSSFFWGYLVTQIPGGFLASLYPSNRIFGTAIACSAFLNLLMPGAMSLDPTVVICIKVLQGLFEGVTYPACHGIWRFWAPPLERSRLATFAFTGTYAGVVVGMPLSGYLISWIDWQAPFYFYGVAGLVWYLFWLWLTFERPSKHPTISARELMYIEQSLGASVQVAMPTFATTPWKDFLRSMPVYAIIVANFCRSWNFYLLVLFQASYLQSSFSYAIEETGMVGALPHLLMTIIVPFGGMLADYVRKKGILTTTSVRKLFNCGGFGIEGLFFVVVAYANSSLSATTALTIGVAFSGFAISGYNVNHLDIAPRYASILMGMSNGIGTIAGLICPIAIDHITTHKDRQSWKIVFLIAASVHFVGITFYGIFASGELQPWAEPTLEEQASWTNAKPKSIEDPFHETTFTSMVGALPYLLMTIIVPFVGMLADYVSKTGILTTTSVRKLFNCLGFGKEEVIFLVLAYANSPLSATTALTIGLAFSGFAISGYNVNHLDIAPRYSSILMGTSNGIGTIAGLTCPITINHITTNKTEEGGTVESTALSGGAGPPTAGYADVQAHVPGNPFAAATNPFTSAKPVQPPVNDYRTTY